MRKRKNELDLEKIFGKHRVPERPDVSIRLHRAFSFQKFLYAMYRIMDNAERIPGLKNVTSLRQMVRACDFWSGDAIPNTFLERCDFVLNFNTTSERDSAIISLKSLCKELRIKCGNYEPMNDWGHCFDGMLFPDMTIEPCHKVPTGEQYMRRFIDMTPEEVKYMTFFKDIRKEYEYEKKQLEEWERTHAAG